MKQKGILYQKHDQLMIFGVGGHARVIYEMVKNTGVYSNIISFDDDLTSAGLGEEPLQGSIADAKDYISTHDLIIAIGNNTVRAKLRNEFINIGANIISVIDDFTSVSESSEIGRGCVVMPGAVVNAKAVIKDGVILNTGSSIDHDNVIDEDTHISVGAHLCGTVHVGKQCFICAGSTIIPNVNLCDLVTVGAGACVIHDITEAGTYVGVPAVKVKEG